MVVFVGEGENERDNWKRRDRERWREEVSEVESGTAKIESKRVRWKVVIVVICSHNTC